MRDNHMSGDGWDNFLTLAINIIATPFVIAWKIISLIFKGIGRVISDIFGDVYGRAIKYIGAAIFLGILGYLSYLVQNHP